MFFCSYLMHFNHFILLPMSYLQTLMNFMIYLRQSFHIIIFFIIFTQLHNTVIIIYFILLISIYFL